MCAVFLKIWQLLNFWTFHTSKIGMEWVATFTHHNTTAWNAQCHHYSYFFLVTLTLSWFIAGSFVFNLVVSLLQSFLIFSLFHSSPHSLPLFPPISSSSSVVVSRCLQASKLSVHNYHQSCNLVPLASSLCELSTLVLLNTTHFQSQQEMTVIRQVEVRHTAQQSSISWALMKDELRLLPWVECVSLLPQRFCFSLPTDLLFSLFLW